MTEAPKKLNWFARLGIKTLGSVSAVEEMNLALQPVIQAKVNKKLVLYLRLAGFVFLTIAVWSLFAKRYDLALIAFGIVHIHLFLNYRYKELIGLWSLTQTTQQENTKSG